MDRVVFLERLARLAEFSRAGLSATFKVLPKHWDKRGITARAVASKFLPQSNDLVGDPTKGIKLDNGLRALRERWQPGMLKSKRRLQVVTPDGTTITTLTRPRAKSWIVQTLVNTERPSSIDTQKLAKSYQSTMGFKPDAAEISKMAKAYGVSGVTIPEIAEKTGGIPMIRRPSKMKSSGKVP
jgi:hypothetical protein